MPDHDPHLGLRFDTVAARYHAVRPRYPAALWDALVAVTGLAPGARVLEIGAGTGIATAELVRRGCYVTALEPGAAMAAHIRRELGPTGRVDVVQARLDTDAWTSEPVDLALGATSLHWIDRAVLHRRLRQVVRPGGHAAMLYYHHVAGGDRAFFTAVQECYAAHAPALAGFRLREPDEAIAEAAVLDGLAGFREVHRQRWLRDIPSSRDHYTALLSTYSTHLALPEASLAALLGCVGELIDADFSGAITKRYRFDLVIAQREVADDEASGVHGRDTRG